MRGTGINRPHLSPEKVSDFVHHVYGIDVIDIQLLPSYDDQNYRLQTADNDFVFKIANLEEQAEVLDLQNQIMMHVGGQRAHLPCPCVLPANTGDMMIQLEDKGQRYWVRLISYLSGVILADVKPQTSALMWDLGCRLGELDAALQDFVHPAMRRRLNWDMQHSVAVLKKRLYAVVEPRKRDLVTYFVEHFAKRVVPLFSSLRMGVIHNDANNYNVLVAPVDKNGTGFEPRAIAGFIDFGDVVYTHTVFELAIACAYAMLGKSDPLATAAAIVAGYHNAYPLSDTEIEVLFSCMCIRLCTSVVMSAHKQQQEPDNGYLSVHSVSIWEMLRLLATIPPQLATYHFREAVGVSPHPHTAVVKQWLQQRQPAPVIAAALATEAKVLDLSVSSPLVAQVGQRATATFSALLIAQLAAAGVEVGIGRYDEARLIYDGDGFTTATGERRTIHLGMDLFATATTAVCAPFAGVVHSLANNDAPLDYGPTVILQHEAAEGIPFYTLYGHLSLASLANLRVGQGVAAGEPIGEIGDEGVNGGWPSHLHFQVMLDTLGYDGTFPGVALASARAVWLSLCPDPNLILRVPDSLLPTLGHSKRALLQKRQQHVGPNLSISYKKHLKIVRGRGQYLYDESGQAYLDGVNNVCHVGHSHPRVVAALHGQAIVLNTNTRYLHDNLIEYAERLAAKFPDPLCVCFFVCSGSEANELALRLARAHTGRRDVLVVDGAYHGNSSAMVDLSPYKFDGRGGNGRADYVHTTLLPDGYRGRFRFEDGTVGKKYGAAIGKQLEMLQQNGRLPAAFFCESLLGCGGQIVLPETYLATVYEHVRAVGGVCVADEVQVGFGRVGSHFWGFETQGVVPDIVTMGKPIGNGHPLAAVITTPEIAASFNNGMEYFNTFGGNPVSCAVGLAVLDVIEQEGLQAHAHAVGEHLKAGLRDLMAHHPIIGDVRGLGLFIGIELVLDRERKRPAAMQASYIAERMRDHHILISTDGPDHNVLKVKPPLPFSVADADHLVATLNAILMENFIQCV